MHMCARGIYAHTTYTHSLRVPAPDRKEPDQLPPEGLQYSQQRDCEENRVSEELSRTSARTRHSGSGGQVRQRLSVSPSASGHGEMCVLFIHLISIQEAVDLNWHQ
jgi:hypothetical protein